MEGVATESDHPKGNLGPRECLGVPSTTFIFMKKTWWIRHLSDSWTPPAGSPAQQGICPLIPTEQANGRFLSVRLMKSGRRHSLLSSMGGWMETDHLSSDAICQTDGERISSLSVFLFLVHRIVLDDGGCQQTHVH